MKFTSELNRKVWEIRKATAKKCSCNVYDVQWGDCLAIARETDINYLDKVCKRYTNYSSLKQLIKHGKKGGLILRLNTGKASLLVLANAFDNVMRLSGKTCRASRTISRKRC